MDPNVPQVKRVFINNKELCPNYNLNLNEIRDPRRGFIPTGN
jgi:hypothetical protein